MEEEQVVLCLFEEKRQTRVNAGQRGRSLRSDLVVERSGVAAVGVHGAQQAVEHVAQNLQVRRAGGEELQLHGADLREQQRAAPRPLRRRSELAQPGRLRLPS